MLNDDQASKLRRYVAQDRSGRHAKVVAVASGKKVKRIAGNKAILDDSDGAELQIPFEGSTLVSVEGPDVESAVHIAENGVGWDPLKAALGQ